MTTQPLRSDDDTVVEAGGYGSAPVNAQATQPDPEPEGSHWLRRLLTFAGVIGVLVALVLGLKAFDLFPSFRNPFGTQTTDRSGPVLLRSIQDMNKFVAAEGNFEVIIDLQENQRFIPDILINERTLFIGAGSVQAYVDFSGMGQGAIVESADGKSVEVRLPSPVLDKPSIDVDRSHTFAVERGLFNRLGDLFGNNPNKQQELYKLAEQKIGEAAVDSELRARAEANTRAMLTSMLKSLGYERVTITFAQP